MGRGSRPRKKRIEVWCDDDELAKIKANAEQVKLSNSEFLRRLGQGYEPKSSFDREAIRQLAKLHSEQSQLGGVLREWLSAKAAEGMPIKGVHSVLEQIESLQKSIARLCLEEARHL